MLPILTRTITLAISAVETGPTIKSCRKDKSTADVSSAVAAGFELLLPSDVLRYSIGLEDLKLHSWHHSQNADLFWDPRGHGGQHYGRRGRSSWDFQRAGRGQTQAGVGKSSTRGYSLHNLCKLGVFERFLKTLYLGLPGCSIFKSCSQLTTDGNI